MMTMIFKGTQYIKFGSIFLHEVAQRFRLVYTCKKLCEIPLVYSLNVNWLSIFASEILSWKQDEPH